MTFDEWKILAKGLKSFYTSDRFLPDQDAIKLWYAMLKDLDYKTLNAAVQKYITKGEFAPTVAQLRKICMEITQGTAPDWGEGWLEVQQAIRKYGYMREHEAMESFTPITKEVVRRLGYKSLCMSENEMADRANFRQCFETINLRDQQQAVLPMTLRNTIQQIQEKSNLLLGENQYE